MTLELIQNSLASSGEQRPPGLWAAVEKEWETAIRFAARTGARMWEIIGLEWADIDFGVGTVNVVRSVWHGHEGPPKGGRSRSIPLTSDLVAALKRHRHLRGKRVFCGPGGEQLHRHNMRAGLLRAVKRAGLRQIGWHVLRHTFCSQLALRGAVPKAIQELAGHTTMTMTMRYMHLAPSALRSAVELLETEIRGNGVATEGTKNAGIE